MRVGILYICTGKYDRFFKDFYESCEKYFMPGVEKTYYVWTDSKDEIFQKEDVVKIYQEKLGWPNDTMMRFQIFNSQRELLVREDFLYFFNANMLFVEPIYDFEVSIPLDKDFTAVVHPSYFGNKNSDTFPYERNIDSRFCIPYGQGEFYYQGCFFGGRTFSMLKMFYSLRELIEEDLGAGIVPLVHDESALNWYFKNREIRPLTPAFAYPESWNIPFEKKIIQLDKSKLGGHDFLRS